MGKSKQLLSGLVVHGLGEIVNNGKRYFEVLFGDSPLPQQQNVVGPFDKMSVSGCMVCPGPKFLSFFSSRGFAAILTLSLLTQQGVGYSPPLVLLSFCSLDQLCVCWGGRAQYRALG